MEKEKKKTTKKTTSKKDAPKKKTATKKATSKTTATKKTTSKKDVPKKKTTAKKPTTKTTAAKKTTTKKNSTKNIKKPVEKKKEEVKITPKKKTTKKHKISGYPFFLPILILVFVLSLCSFQVSNTVEPKQVVQKEKKEEVIVKDGYDIEKLQKEYKNADIIGYLEIPEVMSLPIVRTNDNEYYLTHRLDHSVNVRGTPFMDYRTNFNDKKILIYGHSGGEDDLPFLLLHKYDDPEFFKEHPTIYLFSKEKKYTYQIMSVYLEKNDFDYVNIKSFRGLTWKEHVEKLKNNSKYEIPVEITDESKILILQTCRVEGSLQGGQYKLVIGLLIKEEANNY